jgi:single-stranded DNA-binding protein
VFRHVYPAHLKPHVVVGQLQQRSWTAEDGSARSTVEGVADELRTSLRWGDGDHDQDHAGRIG